MAIYIAKNGQQLGPYSITETQNQLRSGILAGTDLAWQEGLPGWVPLRQISGVAFVPPAAPAIPAAITTPELLNRQRPAKDKSLFQKIAGWIVALVYAAFKFKFLFFGALKTSLSMLLMIWLYSLRFGWPFAVGVVLLILVHEMGHVVAAKWLGIPVSAPLFIPFVGAFITLKESPRDAWSEALMAYGGPFAGGVGSWVCLLAGLSLQSPLIIAIASVSFVLNLFNMIPVPPLDGGRICAAISPWFWLIGLILLGAALFYFHSIRTVIVLAVIVIFATIPRFKETLFGQPTPEMQAYYNTHISNRLTMALMYIGLIAALLAGYWDASNSLRDLMPNS